MSQTRPAFNAPVFLASAFFVFGLAIVEKLLNVFQWSLPLVDVFPRQLVDWAVALLVFEIALSLRQLVEMKATAGAGAEGVPASPEVH